MNMPASHKISPYENIIIGNFLYGLGFNIGRHAAAHVPPVCINLLQQTPLDPKLGDVFLRLGGTVRLLEFKRIGNATTKESIKVHALRNILKDQPKLEAVSRAVHWHVLSGHTIEAKEVKVTVASYLELDGAGEVVSLADFTASTARKAMSCGEAEPSAAMVAAYLKCLGDMATASGASGSGILVHINAEGGIRYLAIRDIRDLNMDITVLRQRENEMLKEVHAERELELTRSHSFEKDKERGLER